MNEKINKIANKCKTILERVYGIDSDEITVEILIWNNKTFQITAFNTHEINFGDILNGKKPRGLKFSIVYKNGIYFEDVEDLSTYTPMKTIYKNKLK